MTASCAQFASAAFAFLAAALWLWSAKVRLPRAITAIDHGKIEDTSRGACPG
jgi:hypothetical protein